MMEARLERWSPVIIASAGVAIWYLRDLHLPDKPEELLSAALTLGSILTGFLATAKAIVASLKGTQVMKLLAQSGYLKDLLGYMASGIWSAFGFSLVCLAGFFGVATQPYFGMVWLFVGLLAAVSFIRVTVILLKIIGYPDTE